MTDSRDRHSLDSEGPTIDTTHVEEGRSGLVVGRYRCLQLIGEGGMGEVWRAEQTEPVRRVVALKLIRLGMSTAHVVARFEAERQALAVMDHPAIARVFDGGATGDGRPYFVMEYVSGQAITAYSREARLSVRARLELFIAVCEGVQHAHQKGIIHRDLKPSNILVTLQSQRPVPKIIDFGIAKATQPMSAQAVYTEVGALIGTPEYMSPEQAQLSSLDIDTRSDVYTLGVILYELLTGVLPFDAATLREKGLDELRRTIREVDPPRPSTRVRVTNGHAAKDIAQTNRLVTQLKGDLDWVVLRALEKDRNRRYGSAAELGADLLRHLHDEPVSASPPSTSYRLRKFVRRNRVPVAAALATVVLLLIFAVAMAIQARRVARARDVAAREAETATRIAGFMEGLFAVSDPSEARGNSITAREVLDKGAERIRQELRSEPDVQARLMTTIGGVYTALGLYQAATPLLGEAVNTSTRVFGPGDPQTLTAMNTLANAYWYQGRYQEAEPLYKQVVEGRRAALGPEHPDTLRAQYDLASLYVVANRNLDEARRMMETTLAAQRRVLGNEHPDTVGSMGNLSSLYHVQRRFEEARTLDEEVYQLRLRTLGADHPRTLTALHNLGTDLIGVNRTADAERVLVEALAGRARVLGPHHPTTAATRLELAVLYADQGKAEAARPLALEAYADLSDGGVSGARLETAKRLIDRLANGGGK